MNANPNTESTANQPDDDRDGTTMEKAKPLQVNGTLEVEEIAEKSSAELEQTGLHFAEETITAEKKEYWYKVEATGKSLSFKTYFRKPSKKPTETVQVFIYHKEKGVLVDPDGSDGSGGSSVAYGDSGMSVEPHTIDDGYSECYFQVALIDGKSPPAQPFLLLATEVQPPASKQSEQSEL